MHTESSSTDLVARHHTLHGFVEAVSQADGVGLTEVETLTTLVVRTDNSTYHITILQAHTREVMVKGGPFFPEYRRACLSGSSRGRGCLKMGWIGIGLHMEFHFADQWMITSHVREISIEPSAHTLPC